MSYSRRGVDLLASAPAAATAAVDTGAGCGFVAW